MNIFLSNYLNHFTPLPYPESQKVFTVVCNLVRPWQMKRKLVVSYSWVFRFSNRTEQHYANYRHVCIDHGPSTHKWQKGSIWKMEMYLGWGLLNSNTYITWHVRMNWYSGIHFEKVTPCWNILRFSSTLMRNFFFFFFVLVTFRMTNYSSNAPWSNRWRCNNIFTKYFVDHPLLPIMQLHRQCLICTTHRQTNHPLSYLYPLLIFSSSTGCENFVYLGCS